MCSIHTGFTASDAGSGGRLVLDSDERIANMHYIMPIVEQLDRAVRELETDHPINNRLALILIDNTAELIIHRRCSMYVRMAKTYGDVNKKHFSAKHRRMAIGPFLEPKLEILQ